jgi:hypothetical protein
MAQPVLPPPTSGKSQDFSSQTWTNWFQSLRAPGATVAPPAHSAAPGIPGQIAFDANFIYGCVAPNVWRRVAWAAF